MHYGSLLLPHLWCKKNQKTSQKLAWESTVKVVLYWTSPHRCSEFLFLTHTAGYHSFCNICQALLATFSVEHSAPLVFSCHVKFILWQSFMITSSASWSRALACYILVSTSANTRRLCQGCVAPCLHFWRPDWTTLVVVLRSSVCRTHIFLNAENDSRVIGLCFSLVVCVFVGVNLTVADNTGLARPHWPHLPESSSYAHRRAIIGCSHLRPSSNGHFLFVFMLLKWSDIMTKWLFSCWYLIELSSPPLLVNGVLSCIYFFLLHTTSKMKNIKTWVKMLI